MQPKALISLVLTAAVVVSATTLPQVEAQVSQLETDVNTLEGLAILPVLPTDGLKKAMTLHNSAAIVLNTIDATVTAIENFDQPGSESACDIVNTFEALAPVIQTGLDALVAQKDVLGGLGVGRGGAIIGLDLIGLRKGVVAIQNAGLVALPSDCHDHCNQVALNITTALDAAIKVYPSQ